MLLPVLNVATLLLIVVGPEMTPSSPWMLQYLPEPSVGATV
jgi:hypothetical protein